MKRLALLVMLLAIGGFSVGCSPADDGGGATTAPVEDAGADAADAAGGDDAHEDGDAGDHDDAGTE